MEKTKRKNNFRKAVAFTLVMALLLSSVGFGGGLFGSGSSEAYASEEPTPVHVSIRIEATTGTALSYTELSVERFDINPFLTGNAVGFISPTNIVSAHALIEAVYYSIYGIDPGPSDLTISSDSPTASAIKEVLNINTDYGNLGIGSIFGDSSLVMSAINDLGGMGIGSDTISYGDAIVFYPWTVDYAYFAVSNPSILAIGDNFQARVPLNLFQVDGWTGDASPAEGATVTAIETTYGTKVPEITDKDGKVTLDLWAGTYLISAEKLSGSAMVISKPYAKVIVGNDGNTTIISPKTPDVGLEKLEIQLPASTVNVKAQLDGGNPYINTRDDFAGVTVTAISLSDSATMSISQSGVSTILTSGVGVYLEDSGSSSNGYSLKVVNGEFSKTYTFYTNKVADAVTDSALMTEVEAIITATSDKGITYYGDYYPEYVTALYANGGSLTTGGKAEFLTDVLDDVRSSNADTSVGRLGKIAAVLSAVGIDPRQVPDVSANVPPGTTIDLIEKISEHDLTSWDSYNAPYMLIGYDSGNYPVATGTVRTTLINYMLDQQNANGGFIASSPDTDTTALYIMALAPYYNRGGATNGISSEKVAEIKISVDNALVYLQNQQKDFGGFSGFWGYANSNSTSQVASALSSIGMNPHGTPFIKADYSVVQGLLSYETTEGLVGVTDSIHSNNVSNVQAMMAVVGYKEYLETGDGNLYEISGEPRIYDQWPSEVLSEIVVERGDITYKSGDRLLPSQLTVSGIFASAGGIRTEILNLGNGMMGYSLEGASNLKAGGNSITIMYLGKSKTFVITAQNNDGSIASVESVTISVKDNKSQTIASKSNELIEAGKTTVLEVLRSLLDSKSIPYAISGGSYVSSINGLSEFDEGAYSGWLYKVNGVTEPSTAAGEYKLTGGENIVWYYTLDFTKDSSSGAWVNQTVTGGAITGSAITESAVAVTFQDISGHWAKEYIQYLAAKGIIRGKAEGMFMPDDAITRAEFVTILGNKFGADYSKYNRLPFGDVKGTDWFAGAVAWGEESGIITGTDGRFNPNKNISRQEMAAILDRYRTKVEKSALTGTVKPAVFADEAEIADYAKTAVDKMQRLGIINGKTSVTFAPKDTATRGEAAKMLAIFMQIPVE